jgi:hypothetical protein
MAKDFNVYQWRRQHLNENQVSEEKGSWKKDFEDIMDANNLTKGEIMDFVSIYFKDEKGNPVNVGLNENEEGMKVSTVTFDQVKGMKLPYDITGGAYIEILRPNVFDEWKDRFMRVYGDADLKANGDRLIASSEKVDALQARAASDIRGAVGTVD